MDSISEKLKSMVVEYNNRSCSKIVNYDDLPNLNIDIDILQNFCKTRFLYNVSRDRGLLFVILQFLLRYNQPNNTHVYIISSNVNIPYYLFCVCEIFSNVIFHYNNTFQNYVIKKPDNLFFEDISINFKKIDNKKYRVLLFCDIRNNPKKYNKYFYQNNILEEPLKYIKMINPYAYCTRFKLPSTDNAGNPINSFKYLPIDSNYKIILPIRMSYNSSEVFIMNVYKKFIINNLIDWKRKIYFNKLFFYNAIIRFCIYYKTKNRNIQYGFDNCYDCWFEENFYNILKNSQKNLRLPFTFYNFREYISSFPGLSIVPESLKLYNHGNLPISPIYFNEYFKYIDKYSILTDIIINFGKFKRPRDEIYNFLKKSEYIKQATTHPTMNIKENYERLEHIGDRLFNASVSIFLDDYLDKNLDVSALAPLTTIFVSGDTIVEYFIDILKVAELLDTPDIDIVYKRQTLKDCFEAILGGIYKTIMNHYNQGISWTIILNITIHMIIIILNKTSLNKLQITTKNNLKEFYDSLNKKTNFKTFNDYYKIEKQDTTDGTNVIIKISLITPDNDILVYSGFGRLRQIEDKACEYFINVLQQKGYEIKSKIRDYHLYINTDRKLI